MRGYIRTRRGPRGIAYQLAVLLGCDEEGRRRYQYETVNGPRREAERRLAELVGEVERGVSGPIRDRRGAVYRHFEVVGKDRHGFEQLLDEYPSLLVGRGFPHSIEGDPSPAVSGPGSTGQLL